MSNTTTPTPEERAQFERIRTFAATQSQLPPDQQDKEQFDAAMEFVRRESVRFAPQDAEPTALPPPTPGESQNQFTQGLRGPGEAALSVGTGIAGGLAGLVLGIPEWIKEGPDEALQVVNDVAQALTYVPRSETGRRNVQALADFMSTDIPGTGFSVVDAMQQMGNPGGEGDPFLGEWIQLGLGGLSGRMLRGMKNVPNVERLQQTGYRVAPADYGSGAGLTRRTMERLGGKAAVEARIIHHNQRNTNQLAARAVGLEQGKLPTPANLDGVRSTAYNSYEALAASGLDVPLGLAYRKAISQIDPDVPGFVRPKDAEVGRLQRTMDEPEIIPMRAATQQLQFLRSEARRNFKSDRPEVQRLAKAQRNAAEALETSIEKSAKLNREGHLYDNYVNARQQLAKIEIVGRVIDDAGNVNAAQLGRLLPRGKWPLGELEQIRFASSAFPKSLRPATSVSQASAGFSTFDLMLGGGFAATISSYIGQPALLGATSGLALLVGTRALGRTIAGQGAAGTRVRFGGVPLGSSTTLALQSLERNRQEGGERLDVGPRRDLP